MGHSFLETVNQNRSCVVDNTFCIGIGKQREQPIPENTHQFSFLLGGDGTSLFREFLKTDFAEKTSKLTIGQSSDCSYSFDYRELISEISKAHLPMLSGLYLGYYHQTFNSHMISGDLGCLNAIDHVSSNLEKLYFEGHFHLTREFKIPNLRSLECWITKESAIVPEKPFDQQTLECLLRSDFPKLEKLTLIFDEENVLLPLSIERSFIEKGTFPNLKYLEIHPLNRDQKERFLDPAFLREHQFFAKNTSEELVLIRED